MKIFIPFNTPSSKNSKVWTGKFLVWSKTAQKYIKDSKPYFASNKSIFIDMVKDLEKPYDIEFTFVRKSKHKFDYPNPLQTVLDLMVKYEWLEDDNADEIRPFFGYYSYDKEKPGVYIDIYQKDC